GRNRAACSAARWRCSWPRKAVQRARAAAGPAVVCSSWSRSRRSASWIAVISVQSAWPGRAMVGGAAMAARPRRSVPGFAEVGALDPDRGDGDGQGEEHDRGGEQVGAGEAGGQGVVVGGGERGAAGVAGVAGGGGRGVGGGGVGVDGGGGGGPGDGAEPGH